MQTTVFVSCGYDLNDHVYRAVFIDRRGVGVEAAAVLRYRGKRIIAMVALIVCRIDDIPYASAKAQHHDNAASGESFPAYKQSKEATNDAQYQYNMSRPMCQAELKAHGHPSEDEHCRHNS